MTISKVIKHRKTRKAVIFLRCELYINNSLNLENFCSYNFLEIILSWI